ncbi:hypothetical protein H6P81_004808 [Aristolochia fimbriata]|uniref:Pentatricopeptide repeat-containing protein n=1 Tax=Aristolochia fimbriata TaxID=158543 RepID=A0AAV7ETD2_ARIFI|nr:hypothetical protein H6P81_004808 [Aristolochia fimbriata]
MARPRVARLSRRTDTDFGEDLPILALLGVQSQCMSASKMFCSTQLLDISCLQVIGQVRRADVTVSVSLVDGVGIGTLKELDGQGSVDTASVRQKKPEKVYRKSQKSKGPVLSRTRHGNGKNPSLGVGKNAEPNGIAERKDGIRVTKKWAAYGGCIPSILHALETISDIGNALKPWEDSLNNKERSIILKEQTNWERALEIFEWFKQKGCYELNVIHYNIILRILGKAQRWKEVQNIWAEMEQKKIVPTNSTYGTLIDVYSKGGLKEQALFWLDKMNKQGLLPDEVTMGIVVQMYKKAGEFAKAEQFFKEWSLENQGDASANGTSQPQKSLSSYTYNTLIDTYGKAGQLREASDTFAQMLREGIVPNTVTFNTMMHICGNCGNLEEVENLMVKMEELQCPPDTRTYNILISLYAKNDNIEMATNYFRKMKAGGLEPDPVGYRTLLYAFSIRHMVQEAEALVLEMDEKGLEIDESTQTALVRMYIDAGLLEQSWSWFERFHLAGKMSSECYSANIDAFGERGHVLLAEKAFRCCLGRKNLSALEFNVMVKAYGICKKYDSACKLFDVMEKYGVCPDKCTYNSLVQILSGGELPYQARCYVRKMQEAGFVEDCIPYCAVISSFVKLGELGVAEEVFEEMVSCDIKPDIVVFGILINAFAEVGSVKEATKYVNAMKSAGFTGNSVIFNSLIKLYTKVGYVEEAQEIYQLLQLSEDGPDVYSSNCMIHLYSEYSMVKNAEEVFVGLKQSGKANEFSYSKMLCMYKKIGRFCEAVDIAREMNKCGLLMDVLSYNNVIGLFVSDGRLKEAAEVFYRMTSLGVLPDDSTFRSLGTALVRCGVSKKAVGKLETARRKDYQGGLAAWIATLRSMMGAVDDATMPSAGSSRSFHERSSRTPAERGRAKKVLKKDKKQEEDGKKGEGENSLHGEDETKKLNQTRTVCTNVEGRPECAGSLMFLSRDFISGGTSVATAEDPSPRFRSCEKANGILLFNSKHNHFNQTASQNFNTQVEHSPVLSSRQRKIREKSQAEEAFETASTTGEILEAFKAMESVFDENDQRLGLACLKVGQHMESEGMDPNKILPYASRALKIFDLSSNPSLPLVMALHLMGSVSYSSKKFNESLGYLNRANRIISKIEEMDDSNFDIRPVNHAVQLLLANTKTAVGRREEAIVNLRKCLEIKESILEPDSRELGVANRDLAEAYVAVLNFQQALPLCMKALEIHKRQLGSNSVEVAHDRKLLAVIYSGLEEHQKALEQNELSQKVLKNWGLNSDLLHAEIEAANIQIALGRYDEAINTLRSVVQQTDKESEVRAMVFIAMGKALCNQEKFADAKRCLEIASGILDKKEQLLPAKVAEAYSDISMLYETMNEFETAISLLKKALAILEKLPQEQHAEGSASGRIGWLLLLTGKVPQAIPYLESAAERLKESFGEKHFGVGYIYNNLGAAYMELDRPQSAAQMFALAKEIMDVALGPHHADSIEACQNLANAYGAMGSYTLAMEFQQRVIDAWESHGPSAKDEFREAHRLLEQLKRKARQPLNENEVPKALPLPRLNDFPTKTSRGVPKPVADE